MRYSFFSIVTILTFSLQTNAQTNDTIPSWRQNQINKIIDLITNDNIIQLSDLICYPIKRTNPIPDIDCKESFILYYSILFDSNFKQKLLSTKFTTDNTIDMYNGFGLYNGDIWLNESGEIITINYSSAQEKSLQKELTIETQSLIYPIVKNWKTNILVCKSDKFLIRIDLLDDNTLRYTSWSSPKSVRDKPDLILFNGIQEFQGTMGGVTYTFVNSNWTYIVDEVDMCDNDEDCGLFLKLLLNDQEKSKTRLKEIK